jgi:hypothetical protein
MTADEVTAYHEAGHAVMAWLQGAELLAISIVADSRALGQTAWRFDPTGKSFSDWALEDTRFRLAGGVATALALGFEKVSVPYMRVGFTYEVPPFLSDEQLAPILAAVQADLTSEWDRVATLAGELLSRRRLSGKGATVVIEGAVGWEVKSQAP